LGEIGKVVQCRGFVNCEWNKPGSKGVVRKRNFGERTRKFRKVVEMKKDILIAKTTNKLLGKTDKQEKLEAKIRDRTWYHRWDELANFLIAKPKPTEKEILKRMHSMLNGVNGYKYAHVAWSSGESLDQVIKDKKIK